MSSRFVFQYLRQPYARLIIPDDEGRYAAQVLEFPGCFSEGESPEEAYNNLEEAAANWIESAHAQGMAIPPPFASQGYSGTVSLRLPKSIHKRAAEYAHRDGVSLNQFLVSAIASRVGAEDLLTALADSLDERLHRLETRGLYYIANLAFHETASGPPVTLRGVPSAYSEAAASIAGRPYVLQGRN